ncbi:extracellular solute-binding protein [Cohnella lupini]|uniref:Carbohydrate ABC transporter substrate-binding protein (CUT1 family) n=1 Tax=Cohnella lupini TaxID=1294267 RepID=A0A3D9IVQ6_9BACL|nr:extracellular solute-binding protein [Cohnella lupini]RED65599.1 carbohydrate ABC transporter substrate-binding protein (CUT1 family) [Cohnella lupini]
MKRNATVMLTLILAMSTLLAACGGKNNNNGTASSSASSSASAPASEAASPSEETVEPFTVSLRHIQIGDPQKFRKAILDEVVKRTEAEVPGVTFELDGIEDAVNRFTKLPAEMAAGNPPKIFDLFGGNADALKYAKAGRLLDLTPIIEELGIKDKFLNVFGQFTLDGKIYGLPIGGSVEGVFYNTELFQANGLNAPTTWDDLVKAADTLKAKGITPFAMGSQAAWVPNMLVGTLVGRYANGFPNGIVTGDVKWNSPEVVSAYTLYQDWVKNGYFTKGELGKSYDDMLNDFAAGKAGMMFDGSWRSSAFKEGAVAAGMAGKVGFVALPALPNAAGDQTSLNANFSNGYGFSSDLDENELKAVTSFIKNLYNDEMQLRGLLEDGVLPSMKLSDESLAQVTDPVVKQVLDVMKAAGSTFVHFDAIAQKPVYSETELQLQKLIAEKASAQEVGDAIQKVQEVENSK